MGKAANDLARELQVAEALTRYLSGTFYALCLSWIALTVSLSIRCFAPGAVRMGPAATDVQLALWFLWAAYLIALFVILWTYRFIRIKEAFDVFSATYAERDVFRKLVPDPAEQI